jgi:hypothetical protein
MAKSADVTLEQVEARKRKAVNFARNVLQDDDLADDLESESPESYAERKRLTIRNPLERRPTPAVLAYSLATSLETGSPVRSG